MKLDINIKKILLILLILLAGAAVVFYYPEISAWFKFAINKDTHPLLFILLFAILPVFGFPITVFLVLVGAKFGYYLGTLIMLLCIPVHLVASLFIAKAFVRPFINYFIKGKYTIPSVPEHHAARFSFVFMAIPGLSYTMKNYILFLSGVPLRYYFFFGLLVNAALGVPMIVAGGVFKDRPLLLIAIFVGLILVANAANFLVKRINRAKEKKYTGK